MGQIPFTLRRPGGPSRRVLSRRLGRTAGLVRPEEARGCRAVSKDRRRVSGGAPYPKNASPGPTAPRSSRPIDFSASLTFSSSHPL